MENPVNNLKKLRKEHKFTQDYLASYLGIDRGTYRIWESGTRSIPSECLIKLHDLFGVSVDYILGVSDHTKSLSVTDKQIEVIKDACELYGRVQIGQFGQLGEIISRVGFSGDKLRHARHHDAEYTHDQTISGCIEAALRGITQDFWIQSDRQGEHDKRTDAEMIAMDIWAALDGRRDDGFCMGTEPLVKVEDDDSPNEKPKTGRWVEVGGFVTPGGDPVWKCSVCGKGMHVYGVEHGTYGDDISDGQWVACPNCGAQMDI